LSGSLVSKVLPETSTRGETNYTLEKVDMTMLRTRTRRGKRIQRNKLGDTWSLGVEQANSTCSKLPAEALSARNASELSLIEPVDHRATAVFLGKRDFDRVEIAPHGLIGGLLLESLPHFVEELGGQIAMAIGLSDRGQVISTVQHSVRIDGKDTEYIREGYLFVNFQ